MHAGRLNSMARCNTVPSGVQIKHTELSSLFSPYCDTYPLENVTHTENGGQPAGCNRIPHFEVTLQQDGQDRATALCGLHNESGRKGYCRPTKHSYNRSPAVVATNVSILNLDSHRSLRLLQRAKSPPENFATVASGSHN